MAIEKIVKTSKLHKCNSCNTDIQIGEDAIYMEFKTGDYESDGVFDTQIGIVYHKYYFHEKCLHKDRVDASNCI